jgi:Domain of unknown function (DUF4112)
MNSTPASAPRTGEYIPAGQPRDAAQRLQRLRTFAWLLDGSIRLPGGISFGIDPLIGLIPGLGDAIGALLSIFIVAEARALGASRSLIVRMIGNVILDTLVGTVPIVGDLFDFAFKANLRNVALLELQHLDPERSRRHHRFFVISMSFLALAIVVAVIAIPVLLVVMVMKLVQ